MKSEVEQLIEELGPFKSIIDPNYSVKKVRCIPDYKPLMHRYKPEHHKYIEKVNSLIELAEELIRKPDWNITVEDKKQGIKFWQRKAESGL